MATITYGNLYSHGGGSWYEPVHDLTGHGGALTGKKKEACEKFMELERAFRTLKLAANAGEEYDVVAARIDREAARYREFLRNPSPIGKIVLNVKKLKGDKGKLTMREQFHVNEPVQGKDDALEGGASVCYTFQKSDDTVLEFWLYDENNRALFPVARSYTNWLGAIEFDLGLKRTFYLNMFENEPGYVKVHAGFDPLLSKQEFECTARGRVTPFPSPATKIRKWSQRFFSLLFPFPAQVAYVIGIETLVVSIVCCATFWGAGRLSARGVDKKADVSAPSLTIAQVTGSEDQSQTREVRQVAVQSTRQRAINVISSASRPASLSHAEKVWRDARLNGREAVTILVDSSLCKDQSTGCHERWSTVEENVQAKVAALHHETATDKKQNESQSVKLLVSYAPTDWQHGAISFSLRDREKVVWNGSQQFDCNRKDPSLLVTAFCTETSWQFISDLFNGASVMKSETPASETMNASER